MATFFLGYVRCPALSPIHSNRNHRVSLFCKWHFYNEKPVSIQERFIFYIKKNLQNILAKEHLILITVLKDHTKASSCCHCGGRWRLSKVSLVLLSQGDCIIHSFKLIINEEVAWVYILFFSIFYKRHFLFLY